MDVQIAACRVHEPEGGERDTLQGFKLLSSPFISVELAGSGKLPENVHRAGTKIEENMIDVELGARSTSFLRAIVAVRTMKTIGDPGN
jgi:hypothetical protein